MLDGYTVIVTKSTVPGRHRRRGRAHHRRGAARRRLRRRLQPGVPARGRGHRATSSAPTASWSAPTTSAPARSWRDLYRPLYLNRDADRCSPSRRTRRADQVRGQRLPGHEDHLHQRDRRPVRAGRRRRAGGRARHRPRQPHRLEVPATPGRATAAPASPRTLALVKTARDSGAPMPHRRDGRRGQRPAQARHGAQGRSPPAAAACAARPIAVLGLTFKPNTDDMRDAPSLAIITALQDAGAKVRAYDPEGMEQARSVLDGRRVRATTPTACTKAPTRWSSSPSGTRSAPSTSTASSTLLKRPVVVDLRNIYRPEEMAAARLHLCQRRPAQGSARR